jgi:hypothetical protein
MSDELFSRRHGHVPEEREITIREDAPEEMRGALLQIAHGEIGLSAFALRSDLCTVLRRLPDSGNWSEFPNVWGECQELIFGAPWYRVYDFIEVLHRRLRDSDTPARAADWRRAVNEYFVEHGIGWKLRSGRVEARGTEAFETVVRTATESLDAAGLPTAKTELKEALRDLSRRPQPDLTGCVQHAMGALECAAREIAGQPRLTLGEILARTPGLVPPPLDRALSQVWGYASEAARHVREGNTPERAEAELILGLSAAACSYLSQRREARSQ